MRRIEAAVKYLRDAKLIVPNDNLVIISDVRAGQALVDCVQLRQVACESNTVVSESPGSSASQHPVVHRPRRQCGRCGTTEARGHAFCARRSIAQPRTRLRPAEIGGAYAFATEPAR